MCAHYRLLEQQVSELIINKPTKEGINKNYDKRNKNIA
jgi:hypothetical protein